MGAGHSGKELNFSKDETSKAWPLPSTGVADGGSSHLFLLLACHSHLWDPKL